MFQTTTRRITVSVEPTYLPNDSDPDDNRYVWAYRVVIRNDGEIGVQLLSRRWVITDSAGLAREVAGRGVVGVQPTIAPGEAFEYTSGCPLATPSGFMVGTYRMVSEDGDVFDVDIPAFPLDLPDVRRVLN